MREQGGVVSSLISVRASFQDVEARPAGSVKPDDPDAKIKFLTAEAHRGVGGLVFDALGNLFCLRVGQEELHDWRDVEVQTSIPSRPEHGGF